MNDAVMRSGASRTGGQALIGQLIEEGVTDLFGIPGVQLDWAVEALREETSRLRFFVPRHEQAASFMADGYARSTGREGVYMVVPGPGILNSLSGLATAYACNSPVLCIAGQIPSHAIGRGLGLLHELPDQSGILKSLTKWHGIAKRPEEIPGLVHEAFVQLRSGRPRPVAIELPPDVLQAKEAIGLLPVAPRDPRRAEPAPVAEAARYLAAARFPVILAGGGCTAANAGAAIQALAEKLQAPVVMTEGARGILSDRNPLALSSLGGRAVLPHADVVLVVGSRFVDALGRPAYSGAQARFIYLNIDPSAMQSPRPEGIMIEADAREGAQSLLAALPPMNRVPIGEHIRKVQAWSAAQTDSLEPQHSFTQALRRSMADDDVLVSELTQVGYYANIALPIYQARRLLTPGYQGTLGYGFNTALGAAIGNPEQRVVSISGDGGFGWGLQELATLARYELDLSVVVFVDGRYGNVQRIQKRTFGAEFATEVVSPDLEMLARAHGISGTTVDTPAALENELGVAKSRGGPALIAVRVGEMPSPWALIHAFVPPVTAPPPNPLGAAESSEFS